VHAVRARPLLHQKNNIEPDEHREEADTFPTRGVNPEPRPAPGLRPALCASVGLVATLLGLRLLFCHVQGLTPLPMLFRPTRGLSNSAGVRPQVRYFFISPPIAGRSEIAAYAAVRFERMLK